METFTNIGINMAERIFIAIVMGITLIITRSASLKIGRTTEDIEHQRG